MSNFSQPDSAAPLPEIPYCPIERQHLDYLECSSSWFVTPTEVSHRILGPVETPQDPEEIQREQFQRSILGTQGHPAWYQLPIPLNIGQFVAYLARKQQYDLRVHQLKKSSRRTMLVTRCVVLLGAMLASLALSWVVGILPIYFSLAALWVAYYGATLADAPHRWRTPWPFWITIPLLLTCVVAGAATFLAFGTALGDRWALPYVSPRVADALGGMATVGLFGLVFLLKRGHDALQTPIERLAPSEPTPQLPPPPPEPTPDEKWLLRGADVQDLLTVRSLASYALMENCQLAPHYFWGGVPQQIGATSNPHKMLIGISGAGKTLTYQILMSAMLPLPRGWTNEGTIVEPGNSIESWSHWTRSFSDQAVVYDAKTENVSFLIAQGFDPDEDLFILNPLDARCYAWDMAADMSVPERTDQLARMLVPDSPNSKEFFVTKSRALIASVVQSFVHAADAAGEEPRWTLRDLLVATRTEPILRHVLSHHRDAEAELAATLDAHPETAANIVTSLQGHLRPYRIAAALWFDAYRRGRKLSLEHWVGELSGSVLVLPDTQQNVAVYSALNSLLFERIASLLLKNEYSRYRSGEREGHLRRRYFYIDELGTAGKFPELTRLLNEGRSRGVELAIGLQSISQLEETYGEAAARTILDTCSFVAMFKAGGPNTAEWMSKRVGQTVMRERRKTYQWGTSSGRSFGGSTSRTDGGSRGYTGSTNSGSTNWSNTFGENWGHNDSQQQSESYFEHELTETPILPSDFMSLDDIESTRQVSGVFLAPHLPIWKATMQLSDVLNYGAGKRKGVDLVSHKNERLQELLPWTPEDYERLCLKPFVPQNASAESKGDFMQPDFGWNP